MTYANSLFYILYSSCFFHYYFNIGKHVELHNMSLERSLSESVRSKSGKYACSRIQVIRNRNLNGKFEIWGELFVVKWKCVSRFGAFCCFGASNSSGWVLAAKIKSKFDKTHPEKPLDTETKLPSLFSSHEMIGFLFSRDQSDLWGNDQSIIQSLLPPSNPHAIIICKRFTKRAVRDF